MNKKILVVEDEAPMLNVLADKLKSAGYSVYKAMDGIEGLSLASTHHPDLILLDLLMPKMDGMTMLNKLRAISWGKNIPVVILTNVSPDTDTTTKAIGEYKQIYYLVKSNIKLEEIAGKIENILKKGK